jgi:hypothetical protein
MLFPSFCLSRTDTLLIENWYPAYRELIPCLSRTDTLDYLINRLSPHCNAIFSTPPKSIYFVYLIYFVCAACGFAANASRPPRHSKWKRARKKESRIFCSPFGFGKNFLLLLKDSQLEPLIVKDKRLAPLHYVQSLTTWQADRRVSQQQKKLPSLQPEKFFSFFSFSVSFTNRWLSKEIEESCV